MKFLCLAAIYNHRQQWIESLVQSLIDQDHDDDIHIIIIDDRAHGLPRQSFNKASSAGYQRHVHIVPMASRADNLLTKYDFGLRFADEYLPPIDAVCVVDDDDIYLPSHISQHAAVLESNPWSYPTRVFSTFGNQFRVEEAGGRFWASSAYRRTALKGIRDYWNPSCRVAEAAYDQQFLHNMGIAYGEAGHQVSPTYIYMWDMTQDNHVSGHIEDGQYRFDQIPESPATGPLVPGYNSKTIQVFEMASLFRAT